MSVSGAGYGGAAGVVGSGAGGAPLPSGGEPADTAGAGATTPASPVGTAYCSRGDQCASGVCLSDVSGVPRCCEGDCRALGRVCSTAGSCVCMEHMREIGGECLLDDGEPCRQAGRCASNRCVDGVCCEASCDRDCERCDAPSKPGQCVFDREDSGCVVDRPGFVCQMPGRCRLPLGLGCGLDADCDSEHCEPGAKGQRICCERSCHGACELCADGGRCDAYPSSDDACPALTCPTSTTCSSYRTPARGECRANGQCAACEVTLARNGVPCGAGEQCDGAGSCATTYLGMVAAGAGHTCLLGANGNVRCWGRNSEGQLGTAFDREAVGDDEAPADVKLELDFAEDVVAVSAGLAHSCVLFASGGVRCWGGIGDPVTLPVGVGTLLGVESSAVTLDVHGFVDPLTAENVRLPGPAVAISAAPAGAHTCALLATGEVACWGYNGDGQCGSGDREEHELVAGHTLPTLDLGGARAIDVRAAEDHTCVLLEGGEISCWGEGNHGRLGYGDDSDRLAPAGTVEVGEPVFAVAVGSTFTCVLLARGRVRCFGSDDDGQLGYGDKCDVDGIETPERTVVSPEQQNCRASHGDVQVGGGEGVVQLAPIAGSHAICGRFAGGSVRCWGENGHGELGYGYAQTFGTSLTPDELAARFQGGDVELGGSVLALADGGRCALVTSGTSDAPALYCWGDDRDGQLGVPAQFPDGSTKRTPIEIGPVLLAK